MSPELLDPKRFGLEKARRTKPSDCYALGMTVYEVLSGHVPFPALDRWPAVMAVLDGKRPRRPQGAGGEWFTDDVWGILERCWNPAPGDRPSVNSVLRCLERASKSWTLSPLMVEGPQVADTSALILSNLTQESVDCKTVSSSSVAQSRGAAAERTM